jgi:hypothetical protein
LGWLGEFVEHLLGGKAQVQVVLHGLEGRFDFDELDFAGTS